MSFLDNQTPDMAMAIWTICRGFTEQVLGPARRALQWSKWEITMVCTKSQFAHMIKRQ